jgi:hypothetical protein
MAQLICTSVLFITVILAGVFSVEVSGAWLRNKREERTNAVREAESRMSDRYDRERASWLAILAEKDRELESMTAMVKRLEKNYEIATRVLSAVDEKKGEAA